MDMEVVTTMKKKGHFLNDLIPENVLNRIQIHKISI